jgi:hypothetical protein
VRGRRVLGTVVGWWKFRLGWKGREGVLRGRVRAQRSPMLINFFHRAGAHWRTHAAAAETEICKWDAETYRSWTERVADEAERGREGESGLAVSFPYRNPFILLHGIWILTSNPDLDLSALLVSPVLF